MNDGGSDSIGTPRPHTLTTDAIEKETASPPDLTRPPPDTSPGYSATLAGPLGSSHQGGTALFPRLYQGISNDFPGA